MHLLLNFKAVIFMFYQEPIMAAPLALGAFSIFLLESNSCGKQIQVQKRKKIVVACFCGPKNVKLGIFT